MAERVWRRIIVRAAKMLLNQLLYVAREGNVGFDKLNIPLTCLPDLINLWTKRALNTFI